MKEKHLFSVFTILFLIFLTSVLVRLPNINRPLSKHHEFITAVALQPMKVWQAEGAMKYGFKPVMNYKGKANKYINNWASPTGEIIDNEGNYYYVSHPPFAYILPYIIFQLLQIEPTALSIQLFNLFTNFISALFVYLIACLLIKQKSSHKINKSALVAYIAYLFSAGVLWFQSNTYMSDILVHTFFIIGVYLLLKASKENAFHKKRYLTLFSVVLFFMIYTSWLGFFFAFVSFGYFLIKIPKNKLFIWWAILTIVMSLTSTALFVVQYASINGIDAYLMQMFQRINVRGSFHQDLNLFAQVKMYFTSLLTILKNYITSYLPLFLILFGFGVVLLKQKKKYNFSKNDYVLLALSGLPVALLHLSLANYSGHDFVSLYGSLFLSLLLAMFYNQLKQTKIVSNNWLNGSLAFLVISSVLLYYTINRPGNTSWKGDTYAQSMQLGTQIAKEASANEVVFAIGNVVIDPQVIYYAQRNIKVVNTPKEALDFLKKRNIKNGIIFTAKNYTDTQFYSVVKISL